MSNASCTTPRRSCSPPAILCLVYRFSSAHWRRFVGRTRGGGLEPDRRYIAGSGYNPIICTGIDEPVAMEAQKSNGPFWNNLGLQDSVSIGYITRTIVQ